MKKLIIIQIAGIFGFFKSCYFHVRYESYRSKYSLAKDFKFNGENIIFYGEGRITIGENSYIGWNSTIQAGNGTEVKIGNNCSISHNVRIYTQSNVTNQNFDVSLKKLKKSGNIEIGNGVWIGVNVFINPGITIGDNVVVGANSVVTKDVESNTIVGGVPAKFINQINLDA
ncbi:MAG: acyltransferase [Ginsengibacter sp.]